MNNSRLYEKKNSLFSVNISEVRGQKKSCDICKKDFTILVKEHQCKRCKRAVCYQCAQTKAPIYRLLKYSKVAHRCCSKCSVESQRLQKFVKDKQLSFGKDTISTQWLQYLNNQMSYPDITSQYSEYLSDPHFELNLKASGMGEDDAYKQYKSAEANMEEIYSTLQDTFNYSLQEFLFFVIDKTDTTSVCDSIRNILKAFLSKHPEFGFSQELLLVIIFILCFASEPIAFLIICEMYENMYPKQFYPLYIKKHGFHNQLHIKLVVQLLMSVYKVPQGDAFNIQTYLDKDFMRMASQFSINTMTFENTFLLIDNTIKAGIFLEFLKGLTAICFIKMEEIKRYSHNIEKLEVVILRNLEQKQIKALLDEYRNIDVNTQQQLQAWTDEEQVREQTHDLPENTNIQSDRYSMQQSNLNEQESSYQMLQQQFQDQHRENQLQTNNLIQLQNINSTQQDELKKLREENFNLKSMLQQQIPYQVNQSNQAEKNEDLLAEYQHLLNDDDLQKQRSLKALFKRVRLLQKELRFKNIDIQIKREYLVSLQRKVKLFSSQVSTNNKDDVVVVEVDTKKLKKGQSQDNMVVSEKSGTEDKQECIIQ